VVDARSDVFSLGVLLYELLSGRRPFAGDNAVDLIDAIIREPPPPLVRDGADVAPEIARVVLHMLEKDPERRHPDMRAVARDLVAILSGRALSVAPSDDGPAVAVIGFTNITKSPEDDWLGIGIAETLTTGLSGLPGLTVLSRERVVEVQRKLAAAGRDEEALVTRLGQEVGARLVVSGAYQRMGERVRVTARVTEVGTETVTETLKLDGGIAEIFALQDQIVGELSARLRLRLPATGGDTSELLDTSSVEAYEAYAKGLINLRAESPEALDRAILFFERAVALDPAYARAHAQLGSAYDLKGDYLSMPELETRALASLDRALALRPGFAEAHRRRAGALLGLGREEEALVAAERALALDPADASGHSTLARVHFIGRGDFATAADYYDRSLSLNPQAGWSALQLAQCAALLGDFTRAEAAAWRAVVLQEEFLSGKEGLIVVGAYVRLGQVFALQGRYPEALHQFEREVDFLHRVDHALRARIFIELHQRMGEVRLRLGEAEAGRAELRLAIEAFERRLRTGADDPSTRYYAACAYALLGDLDDALSCLEKAAKVRPRFTRARAAGDPALESLRGHDRFRALLDEAKTATA
jgi:tetratricopeptide (TPR) repeat protein